MDIFYQRLKDTMPKRGSCFSLTFLVFLVSQALSPSLFAILEEDKLTECLKKRLTSFENPLDRDHNETQIQTLYKSVQEYYEPLISQDPEAAITLGIYRTLVTDGKKGLSYILSFANQGHARAQYLTGFFLCHLKRKPEAMRALADAALQGHQKALEDLKVHAYQLKESYALLELSRFFFYRKEKAAEAQCLEHIIDNLVLLLPRLLIQGYIRSLHDDFVGALNLYREVAVTDPERAQPYVNHLFQDPNALFHLLKANAFQDKELEKCQEVLITNLSKNEEQLTELSTLAHENPDATYIFGCILFERQKANNNKNDDLFPLTLLDPFFFLARLNHKLAEQKLKQIVDQHRIPELLYSYGRFLLERGEPVEGENYLRQVMKNNFKPAITLTSQPAEEKKSSPTPSQQAPQKPSPTKSKVRPDWLLIGCQLEGSNKWVQAIEAFKKVSSSQRLEASYHLGRIYYKLSKKNKETQPEEALQQAKKAHEFLELLGDQHPGALYTLGKLFYLEQETEKAEEKWEEALKLGYSASLYRLGILYADKKEDMVKVRTCFREAGKEGIPKAWYRAAWLSSAMGDVRGEIQDLYHGAIEDYQPCLISLVALANKESTPAFIPALFNLGVYYFAKQRYGEARVCWDKIPSLQDDLEYARRLPYNYAQLALQEGNIEEAIKLFMDSANAGFGLAYASLGKIFWENKKEPKTALDFYNKALEMETKNGEILYDLAIIHYSLGNMDEAVLKAAEANLYEEEDALSLLKEIYQKTKYPLAAFILGNLSLQNDEINETRNYWKVALGSLDITIKNAVHFSLCMTTFVEGNLAETIQFAQQGIQDGETRFIDNLQVFAHSENPSPVEKEKKARARKVLKKLGISLKKPTHSEPLNQELS